MFLTFVLLATSVFGNDMHYSYLWPSGAGARMMSTASENTEKTDQDIQSILNKSTVLKVYPNPANSSFTLLYSSEQASDLSYYMYDILGHEVRSGSLNSNVK